MRAEVVVAAGGMAPRADDPELFGHQTLAVEPKEPREQLASGQIAGGAE